MAAPLLLAASAAHGETPAAACRVDDHCVVTGIVTIAGHGDAWVGVIDTGHGCLALALPDAVLADPRKWGHKKLRVSGVGYPQPDVPDLMWFSVKDRKVSAHYCDEGVVIYVDSIELAAE